MEKKSTVSHKNEKCIAKKKKKTDKDNRDF